MDRFLKGMGVGLMWLCVVGGLILIIMGLANLDSPKRVARVLGGQQLVMGLVAGLLGAVQAALVWAAGRGLELLERTSRYYFRAARIQEADAKATHDLLGRILEALPAAAPRPYEVIPEPPAEEEDERFKLMTPEEAERMFDTQDPET